MTANEMAYRFKVLYDIIAKDTAPGYKDREISALFNICQLEIVKSYYIPQGNKYGKGFENTEKRRKDLANLVKNVYLYDYDMSINQSDAHKDGYIYELPTDFLWAIQEECDMDIYSDDCSTALVSLSQREPHIMNLSKVDFDRVYKLWVKPVTHDEYNVNINNPFKKPYEEMLWRLDIENSPVPPYKKRHELINPTSMTILRYRIRYIKLPIDIVVDNITPTNQINCELIETLHDEIVSRVVRRVTGITQPELYKIMASEELKTE